MEYLSFLGLYFNAMHRKCIPAGAIILAASHLINHYNGTYIDEFPMPLGLQKLGLQKLLG